jgi:hypothetical protein
VYFQKLFEIAAEGKKKEDSGTDEGVAHSISETVSCWLRSGRRSIR